MGTHISRVKSVSMDQWSAQEIKTMMEKGGNIKVNQQMTSNSCLPLALDDNFAMEKYIRDKWERRLFQKLEIDTRQETLVPTPTSSSTTTTSSALSSPRFISFTSSPNGSLAGRASLNENNPFLKQNTNPFIIKSHNPFLQ
ncbi:unnamed protein product [Rhizopus stolonifer]